MSIRHHLYILRVSCVFYSVCSISLLILLSILSTQNSNTYNNLILKSLKGPIKVQIISVNPSSNTNCIYYLKYSINSIDYYNFYDYNCLLQSQELTIGYYKSNNHFKIYLDKTQLECSEIKDCNYYYNLAKFFYITTIITSIINTLIILFIVLRIHLLKTFQPTFYPSNTIFNPLHFVVVR